MSGGTRTGPTGTGDDFKLETDCESIFETTILNSPNPEVLGRLSEGDLLKLQIQARGPRKVLVAVDAKGDPAGSITTASLSRIIRCIEKDGYSFISVVLAIEGGKCTVEIRPEA